MFTTLHRFEDKDFLTGTNLFISIPRQESFTYKIISAFQYDDRHIMNTNDFSDRDTLLEFQHMLLNPEKR